MSASLNGLMLKNRFLRRSTTILWGAALILVMAGCHDRTSTTTGAASYTVGGTVSGLVGSGLVLQDNGADNLSISGPGSFTFATALAANSSYAISVLTQPSNPTQICTVSAGSGTVGAASISDVMVSCSAPAVVANITITSAGLVLAPGGNRTLTARAVDTNGQPISVAVTWQSADPSVASVDSTGLVRAIAVGQAQITASVSSITSTPVPVYVNPPGTSSDLLKAAVVAGQLTADQALVYQIWSIYGDDRLPVQYRGTTAAIYEDDLIMDDAAQRFDSLTPDQQLAIGSYFIPPAYAHSNLDSASGRRTSAKAAMTESRPRTQVDRPGGCDENVLEGWDSVATPEGHFKVWYETGLEEISSIDATIIGGYAENAYKQLVTVGKFNAPLDDTQQNIWTCSGGDSKLDIYLMGTDFNHDIGAGTTVDAMTLRTALTTLGSSAAFIEIPIHTILQSRIQDDGDLTLPGTAHLKATVAHEFMHAIQWGYPQLHLFASYHWSLDATANWAMDAVNPSDDIEHQWALGFLSRLDTPLFFPNHECGASDPLGQAPECIDDSTAGLKKYGAYLLFQYLTKTTSSYDVIKTFYAQATFDDDALDNLNLALGAYGLGGLQTVWPKVALSLWNQDGVPDNQSFRVWDNLTESPLLDPTASSGPDQPITHGYAQQQTYDQQTLDLSNGAEWKSIELPTMHSRGSGAGAIAPVKVEELASIYNHFKFGDGVRSAIFYNGFSQIMTTLPLVIGGPVGPDQHIAQQPAGRTFAVADTSTDQNKGRAVIALMKINDKWTSEEWTNMPFKTFCFDKQSERLQELVLIFANGNSTTVRSADFDSNAAGPMGDSNSRLVVEDTPCYKYKGMANATFSYKDSMDSFTITTTFSATFTGGMNPVDTNVGGIHALALGGWVFGADADTMTAGTTLDGQFGSCGAIRSISQSSNLGAAFFDTTPQFNLWTSYPGDAGFNVYTGSGRAVGWQIYNCVGATTKNLPTIDTFDFSLALDQLRRIDSTSQRIASGLPGTSAGVPGPVYGNGDYPNAGAVTNTWCFAPVRDGDPAPTICQ